MKPAWEEFADYEKNDSTYDGLEIPYERDDPHSKLDRIDQLIRKGKRKGLSEKEIEELDSLWLDMFGCHLDENEKKVFS